MAQQLKAPAVLPVDRGSNAQHPHGSSHVTPVPKIQDHPWPLWAPDIHAGSTLILINIFYRKKVSIFIF